LLAVCVRLRQNLFQRQSGRLSLFLHHDLFGALFMQVFSLEARDTLTIGEDTEVEIIEIRQETVRIAIRSRAVSPYYWEEELSLESSDPFEELISL
jgi:hypothetical protein